MILMILKLTLFQKALTGLSTSLESYLEAFHNMKKKFDGIKTPETGMILILTRIPSSFNFGKLKVRKHI